MAALVASKINTIIAEIAKRLDPANRRSKAGGEFLDHVDRIICADGFRMSVQANSYHYCSPRDSVGPWTAVEVGFPTERIEEFMPYIDGHDSVPTETVYGYVPVSIVARVIDAHGGFASRPEGRS